MRSPASALPGGGETLARPRRTRRYRTLLPLLAPVAVDPDDFAMLVAAIFVLALPMLLGWPWFKIFVLELRNMARKRSEERAAAAAKGSAGAALG